MNEAAKPVASWTKKLLVIAAATVTVAGLVYAQNIVQVKAADDQKFVKVTDVQAGDTFATILTDDGAVYSKGWNSQGQLGVEVGAEVPVNSWTKVTLDEPVSSISGQYDHASALTTSGHLFTWGPNSEGAAGNGTQNPQYTPTQVTGELRYNKLATGGNFTVALDSSGKLWTWGNNDAGQLGNGTTESSSEPVAAETDLRFANVFAGNDYAFAIDLAGGLYSWGNNDAGQLGNGSNVNANVPTPTGAGLTWSQVATNPNSKTVAAISTAGDLFTWGENKNGELGIGADWRKQQADENARVQREIEAIKARDADRKERLIDACVAQKVADATAAAAAPAPTPSATPTPGATATPRPTPTPTPKPIDPQQFVDGCTAEVNSTFQATDTSNLKPAIIPEPELQPGVTAPVQVGTAKFSIVSVGSMNVYAIDTNSNLYAWGSDANGQTGLNLEDEKTHTQVPVQILKNVMQVSAGDRFAYAVQKDNTLLGWGLNTDGVLQSDPAQEPKLLTPTKKDVGYTNVVTSLTTVYGFRGYTNVAWGNNRNGELGTGDKQEFNATPAETTRKLSSVSSFRTGAVGLGLSGELLFWGTNSEGEFGDLAPSTSPVYEVTNNPRDVFTSVSSGYLYTLAVDESGAVWGWGSNISRTVNPESAEPRSLYPVRIPLSGKFVSVAAGQQVAAAYTTDKVLIWGEGLGSTVQSYDFANAKSVSAGNKHVVVLAEDGTVWNWGDDSPGAKNQSEQMKLSEADTETKYSFVTAGGDTTFGVTVDGDLEGWGSNPNNILETKVDLGLTKVSVHEGYVLGVDQNGVVWGWGYNPYRVFGLTSTKPNPTALPLILDGE